MIFECLVNDPASAIETPPFTVDFEGEPQAGDFVYRGDGPNEQMFVVQGRFWRRTTKAVRSEVFQTDVNRAVHAMFLGVRPVAAVQSNSKPS